MNLVLLDEECERYNPFDPHRGQEQIYVQLTLSLALGLSALFGFCFLRPRWKSFYAARKCRSISASELPELPDSFLGWIPILHNVTEDQVLETAGLDAYVFLAFFKMSIRLFSTIFFIAIVVLAPINSHFDWLPTFGDPQGLHNSSETNLFSYNHHNTVLMTISLPTVVLANKKDVPDPTYLWAYLIFTYVFTGLAIHFMTSQTKKIIKVRQKYLGCQSSVTYRTFKLSGVPPELRTKSKIRDLINNFGIGRVRNVSIARNWKNLDRLMDERAKLLKKLEAVWAIYLNKKSFKENKLSKNQSLYLRDSIQTSQAEDEPLLNQGQNSTEYDNCRPKSKVYFGIFSWHSRKVDAIDLYEERLRRLDEKIINARNDQYPSTSTAFITMDSISACQIAVQTLLDPSPLHLIAKPAPAPTDIVWQNINLPRYNRMIRAWVITIFIIVLTIFWVVPVAALAGLLDICSIQHFLPKLVKILSSHDILKSLVQTGLPTLVVSLLNIGVPFLYDFLSNQQGMTSQGDVELSLISKNFFFTFFNVFLTFTVAGTATKFWSTLHDSLKDTTFLALKLAGSVQQVAVFFTNFILLQGIGLIPFRLLEFGSVSLYPIMRMCSKSPRDYWELMQPPVFKYGFYLPSAILVYILCIVYSILPAGYMVLFFGIIYFINSYYTYKYQLLYAMDHPQHVTEGAWPIICYRILLGLCVFQIVMAGIIALKNQFYAASLVVPLIPFTIWYSYYFGRTYHPLMKFIAFRSIQRKGNTNVNNVEDTSLINFETNDLLQRNDTFDEEREEESQYLNPNLSAPLVKPWIMQSSELNRSSNYIENEEALVTSIIRENSVTSSLSLGDTHVWRQNSNNV
ncbi:Calcium permeable stress-gated cation channel 1 [Erysiphe neolycopersici]|uniref:Calcium permeable stress-gated cation channel 1 n=1 Tax=Erysiphe neolycopersici TaxID=212602 RepID=A0A420HTY6_9PEZI|nr:Calcium permeable stress-gated cation channel 1 [Erysiphe neolycopersici]